MGNLIYISNVLFVVLILLSACADDDPAVKNSNADRQPIPRTNDFRIPRVSCTFEDTTITTYTLTDSLMADRGSVESNKEDAFWIPTRLKDYALLSQGYALLDAAVNAIVILDEDLNVLSTLGGTGEGPGELGAAGALSVGMDSLLYVFDANPVSLELINTNNLQFIRSLPFRSPVSGFEDIAIMDDYLYGTRSIFGIQLNSGLSLHIVFSYKIHDSVSVHDTVLTITDITEDLERRFILPGPNPINITAGSGYVAVYYRASGYIDILVDDEYYGSVKLCLPEQVRTAYRAQRQAMMNQEQGRQQSLRYISDVRIENGILQSISSIKTEDGYYHIDYIDIQKQKGIRSELFVLESPEPISRLWFGKEGKLIGITDLGDVFIYSRE